MASYRKRGGSWAADVRLRGIYEHRSFRTKGEAIQWAQELERRIRAGQSVIDNRRTVSDLLDRYSREVSPRKAGRRWEQTRLLWIQGQPFAALKLSELTPAALAQWRDSRLEQVSGETIRRDMNLLSHALRVAANEWGWLPDSPLSKVRRPAGSEGRDRTATDDEIARICHVAGYAPGDVPQKIAARVAALFCLSVETGMRPGEICALRRSKVTDTVAKIESGKTRAARRPVPLFPPARPIIAGVIAAELWKDEDEPIFALNVGQVDTNFRKLREKAGIVGLNCYDARATFITRMAKKLDILTLARIVGHKDLSMLQRYYRESAESIAARL